LQRNCNKTISASITALIRFVYHHFYASVSALLNPLYQFAQSFLDFASLNLLLGQKFFH